MTDTPIDAQTLSDLPQGALDTLLSTARSETGAVVALVALYRPDGSFAITTSMEEDAPWDGRALATLARSIWLDPDLTVGKVLASRARVEGGRFKKRQGHVASVVLSDPATPDLEWGLLSIIASTDRQFSAEQTERVVTLSGHLAAYLSARERMIHDLEDVTRQEQANGSNGRGTDVDRAAGVEERELEDLLRPTFAASQAAIPAGDPDPSAPEEPTGGLADADLSGDQTDATTSSRSWVGTDVPPESHGEADDADNVPDRADNEAIDERLNEGAPGAGEDERRREPDDDLTITLPVAAEPGRRSPKRPRSEDIGADEDDEETSGSSIPQLTLQVVDPSLVAHIADAMDAISDSVESVVLIHLRIMYDDTAAIVPTEAARKLVAKSTKSCVRQDDYVARVGENSFVVVTRLRPGSPEPAYIERRLKRRARKATGWIKTGPTFRTRHLVVEAEGAEDPEDVLLALLDS